LIVAVTILGIGGLLATRLMVEASRELDGAELALRAVLFLSELHRFPDNLRDEEDLEVGPGRFEVIEGELGVEGVRYLPPGEAGGEGHAGAGGYLRARSWHLDRHP
jgi:hypothetical protein